MLMWSLYGLMIWCSWTAQNFHLRGVLLAEIRTMPSPTGTSAHRVHERRFAKLSKRLSAIRHVYSSIQPLAASSIEPSRHLHLSHTLCNKPNNGRLDIDGLGVNWCQSNKHRCGVDQRFVPLAQELD
ncbi:hypothetical protein L210DRAFT_2201420 [Boletus edulis BED1]|uniref:Secreted protein n=1 Tax=Boletus edulis BED1 TaxID=1328754 RepID=A0AAD4BDW2_BOLED|nr:hypothetical protein L210DRAFT_2201420 [Boletus edulis BED1]